MLQSSRSVPNVVERKSVGAATRSVSLAEEEAERVVEAEGFLGTRGSENCST